MHVNKQYLKDHQYQNADNLLARRAIFKFGTNPESLWNWFARQYSIPSKSKILEVGCGQGAFWQEAINTTPKDCDVTLTDFSTGMLGNAKNNLKDVFKFKFEVADVENLPYESQSFDIIFAHLMLYHANSPEVALQEIRRVLKNRGFCGILLSSKNNMSSLFALLGCENPRQANRFSAEIAADVLPKYFTHIKEYVYQNTLKVTEVEPIIDYVRSFSSMDQKEEEFYSNCRRILTENIKDKGFLSFETPRCLFIVS